MGTANRRRRRKAKRAFAASQACLQNRMAESPSQPSCPLTDISHLRATVQDIEAAARFEQGALTWYVVRVEPAAEGKALAGLRERRIAAYCPSEQSWRWTLGKKRLWDRPLFTGYIFVGLGPRRSLYEVHHVLGVDRVVESFGKPAEVDPWAVLQIAAAEMAGLFDRTGPRRPSYAAGQPVLVTTGRFAGFIAKVIEERGDKVRILFESGLFIGSPFAVNSNQIEAADVGTYQEQRSCA